MKRKSDVDAAAGAAAPSLVKRLADFFLGKRLDCGARSSDWTDHVGHETPECKAAMERYFAQRGGGR